MKRSSGVRPETCSSAGGGVKERMIGWSVTTLMKIEMIQNEHRMASFWMIGMRATRRVRMARPSARIDTMAGA